MQKNVILSKRISSKFALFFLLYSLSLFSADQQIQIAPDYVIEEFYEVCAAHHIRALVFRILKQLRQERRLNVYVTDEQKDGFTPYENCPEAFHINQGLLFCVNEHNVPGLIITRWGAWHFSQDRALISDKNMDTTDVWNELLQRLCRSEEMHLQEVSVRLDEVKKVFVVNKVKNFDVLYPCKIKQNQEEKKAIKDASSSFIKRLSRSVSSPVIGTYARFSKNSKEQKKTRTRARVMTQLYPCSSAGLDSSAVPTVCFKTAKEIQWLTLCQVYNQRCKDKDRYGQIERRRNLEEQATGRAARKKIEAF